MIICCSYEQAKAFQEVYHAEMDLAFKLVQGETNVFTIASFDERSKSMFA